MSTIVVTAAQVGLVDPEKAEVKSYLAAATITKGQAIAFDTNGKLVLADGNSTAALAQARGIAISGGGSGQAVDVCHKGDLYGFTVSSLNADAFAYLSATPGALDNAVSTYPVVVGRVVALTDKDATKVLRVETSWLQNWTSSGI